MPPVRSNRQENHSQIRNVEYVGKFDGLVLKNEDKGSSACIGDLFTVCNCHVAVFLRGVAYMRKDWRGGTWCLECPRPLKMQA